MVHEAEQPYLTAIVSLTSFRTLMFDLFFRSSVKVRVETDISWLFGSFVVANCIIKFYEAYRKHEK